jgi:pimeloyl-ACP methyl ester carboxylesterase
MSTSESRASHEYTEGWCEGGEIGHVELSGGARVRYLRVGSGPPLLLMHTVRTQLDHFQFVIPPISDAFTLYALDFPGMGWSDIVPGASYEEPALRATAVRVVQELDLSDLTLAGESMGATVALTASLDLGDRVRRIVAFNAYDFADGVKRANLLARLVIGNVRLPVWGPIGARLETKRVLGGILRGGLHDPRNARPLSRRAPSRRPAPRIPDGGESDLPQPREPDRGPRALCGHQRAGDAGLRRRRLVATLRPPSQHRHDPRRPPHRPARYRPLRRARGSARCGAYPARQNPLSAALGSREGRHAPGHAEAQVDAFEYADWRTSRQGFG